MTVPNKIDSNVTGLAFAEETDLKTLPESPVWYALEPNSFNDFGGELSTVARAPFSPSRQRSKGAIVDLSAAGGVNIDYTQNNMLRLLQGFFFANANEKPDTQPLNGSAVTITGVTGGATNRYAAASGLNTFLVNSLILASGFSVSTNNGLKSVKEKAAAYVGTNENIADEVSPPAAARLQVVGFQFPTGDLSATASAGNLRLTSASIDLRTLGLVTGEWIFLGGDGAGLKFATCPVGYARIKTIAQTYVDCDYTTFAAVTDAGTGKTVQVFFGKCLKNQADPTYQVRRSLQLERQLGNDGDGTQSEYLTGAIPNEFTLNVPVADKLNADLSFVACDNEQRSGLDGLKAGTRVDSLGESCFNTSSDIYRVRMNVLDSTSLVPTALFGYVLEANIAINNNVSPNKAVGVLGAFDCTAGLFEVTGSITAYFSTIAATEAVRGNADVCMNFIGAKDNAGFVFDIPLLGLGNGKVQVEKDQPIKVPLDMAAAKNALNYTLLHVNFPYLPNAAMPA